MKKSIDIKLNGKFIDVKFNKELKNHFIYLRFEIINTNELEISSTDIRNINIHTLIKRSLKSINSYREIDVNEFNKNTKNLYKTLLNQKNYIKEIRTRKIKDRNKFLAIYSYLYQKESRNYGDNVSKKLAKNLNYTENYIKNLTKEAFNKNYLINNTKGISGGNLSAKTVKILNSL